MVEYRYLQPEDAENAADIHIEGQPGTLLTLLGRSFLIELYRAICFSKWGEGIGVYDNGRLIAQTAMAVSSARFFAEFKRRHLWRVAVPIAFSVIKRPVIIINIIKGWNYSKLTQSPEREGDVIFLGVTHDYRRHGLGPEIVRHMFGWAETIGLKSANFMIEKRNRPMRWMIGELKDLYIAHEFEAYGRPMLFYKIPIASNLTDAKLPQGNPCTPAYDYSKDNTEEKTADGA